MRHGPLAEHGPEEEEDGAAAPGAALPGGLPAGREAVLPARKALSAAGSPPALGPGPAPAPAAAVGQGLSSPMPSARLTSGWGQ